MSPAASAAFGLVLLLAVAATAAVTGMAMWAALLAACSVGSLAGLAFGVLDLGLLGALPARITGLLENDLLQAVPLFVLTGALLDRLPLADLIHRAAWRLCGRGPAAPLGGALALSVLLAPMNGSVGASVSLFSRVVSPRLAAAGIDAAGRTAFVAAVSTLGVLIPPSLVLLLLGDALMRAHTEAANAGAAVERIVNTQDLMHAVVPAATMVVALFAIAVARRRRGSDAAPPFPRLGGRQLFAVIATVATIALLLGGVAIGRFQAIEAAATGCALLLVGGIASGRLSRADLSAVVRQTAVVSGSLFALFVAATSFTLLLHGLGTDRWVAESFGRLGPGAALALALAVLVGGALVLDAFELIFVVIPILLPPVLTRVPDAAWVGALVLIALQLGFLLPPLGYAVMMSAARESPAPRWRELLAGLRPAQAAIALVFAVYLLVPRLAHCFDAPTAPAAKAMKEDEVERRMREMSGR